MRIPPIDKYKLFNSIDLLSVKGTKPNKSETPMRMLLNIDSSVNVTISEESKRILSEGRENLYKYGIEPTEYEYIEFGDIDVSGELMMEHYWAMGKAENNKVSNAEDYARDVMSGYEVVYHEIMKMHETGDREFSSLYGKGTVTIEEDLEGLDKAFEMSLRDLEGYISCQQTKKVTGSYNLENYREDIREMMEQARKEFIETYESKGYRKFMGSNIISRIISENPEFSFKTGLLFF